MSNEGGSYLFDKKCGKICSLSYIHYSVCVFDFVMHMHSTQKYKNESSNPQELVYKFFVSKTHTIYSIEIEIYDPKSDTRKKMKAKIYEKEEAKEKYDDSIAEGKTSFLVEEEEGKKDVIDLNLGNIGIGWEITIEMKVSLEIESEKNVSGLSNDNSNLSTLKIMLPSSNYYGQDSSRHLSDNKVEKNVSFDFNIQVKYGNIKKIVSPSHQESLDIIEEQNQVKVCTKGMICLSTDFLLHIIVESTKFGIFLVEKNEMGVEEEEEEFPFCSCLSIIPQIISEEVQDESEGEEDEDDDNNDDDEGIYTEIIFCLDCSGSMGGSRMNNAKNALIESIHLMSQKRKVYTNIVRFGTRITSLYPSGGSKDCNDSANKQEILDYINSSSSNMGGTNIHDAIEFALSRSSKNNNIAESKQVILISDGEDYKTEEIIQMAKKNTSTTRIFCIGIGNSINKVFMTQLAHCSNGRSVFIDSGSDIQKKVVKQFSYILQKSISLTDVKFFSGDEDNNRSCISYKSCLNQVPPIYNLQKFSLYYLLKEIPTSYVEITYSCGGKEYKQKIEDIVIPLMNEDEKNILNVLSAKKRVLEIEDFHLNQEKIEEERKKNLEDEIIRISKKYQFLTSLTSFLLVYENEEGSNIPTNEIETKHFSQLMSSGGDSSTTTSRGGGTCYSIYSSVFVMDEQQQQPNKKQILEIQKGDRVQSFDCEGNFVYSEVTCIHYPDHHAKEARKVRVMNIKCENGESIKVTESHFLYVSSRKIIINEEDRKCSLCNSYRMKIAKLVKIGDYLLHTNNYSLSVSEKKQVKVTSICYEMDYVANPMVENTRLIVNGFYTSILTNDNMLKNSMFLKFENTIAEKNLRSEYEMYMNEFEDSSSSSSLEEELMNLDVESPNFEVSEKLEKFLKVLKTLRTYSSLVRKENSFFYE